MKIKYYGVSDTGISREHNEDFLTCDENFGLFMIADGMGGYQFGDVASQLALNSILKYLNDYTNNNGYFSNKTFEYAIDFANNAVFNFKKSDPSIKNMGTTFVSFVIAENEAYAFHIGDSRVYNFRRNKLVQLTKDHSAEQEVLPDFMQNANEGKYSSVLTRALGTDEKVKSEMTKIDLKDKDLYLICSDGLYSMVDNDSIKTILSQKNTIKEKCLNLIAKANENGGEDNITAILIEISSFKDKLKFEYSLCD